MAIFDPETKEFYCECKCGTVIPPWNSYAYHHWSGSEEGRESARRIGEANLGIVRDESFCQNLRNLWREHPEIWGQQNTGPAHEANTGRVKSTEECRAISEGVKKAYRDDPTYAERISEANWKGGYDGLYGYGWEAIRDLILARDNHTCQGCGSKLNLEVHHIDGDTSNIDKENLVAVCHSCNMRAASKYEEDYWREFYTNRVREFTNGDN